MVKRWWGVVEAALGRRSRDVIGHLPFEIFTFNFYLLTEGKSGLGMQPQRVLVSALIVQGMCVYIYIYEVRQHSTLGCHSSAPPLHRTHDHPSGEGGSLGCFIESKNGGF